LQAKQTCQPNPQPEGPFVTKLQKLDLAIAVLGAAILMSLVIMFSYSVNWATTSQASLATPTIITAALTLALLVATVVTALVREHTWLTADSAWGI
jgi:hypothetical protein